MPPIDKRHNFFHVKADGGHTASDTVIPVTPINPAQFSVLNFSIPCPVTWYNHTDYPGQPSADPFVEICLVTGFTGSPVNSLTLLRGQEGTAASDKNIAGKEYRIVNAVTAKYFDEIETGLTDVEGDVAVIQSDVVTLQGDVVVLDNRVDAIEVTHLSFDPPNAPWVFVIPDGLTKHVVLRLEATDPLSFLQSGQIVFPTLASVQDGMKIEIHAVTQSRYTRDYSGATGDTSTREQYRQTTNTYIFSDGVWRHSAASATRDATAITSFLFGPAATLPLPDPLSGPFSVEKFVLDVEQFGTTPIESCNFDFATNSNRYILGTEIVYRAGVDIPVITYTGLSLTSAAFPTSLRNGESFTVKKVTFGAGDWVLVAGRSPENEVYMSFDIPASAWQVNLPNTGRNINLRLETSVADSFLFTGTLFFPQAPAIVHGQEVRVFSYAASKYSVDAGSAFAEDFTEGQIGGSTAIFKYDSVSDWWRLTTGEWGWTKKPYGFTYPATNPPLPDIVLNIPPVPVQVIEEGGSDEQYWPFDLQNGPAASVTLNFQSQYFKLHSEILFTTNQAWQSLVFSEIGVSFNGMPSSLAANGSFRIKKISATEWRRIDFAAATIPALTDAEKVAAARWIARTSNFGIVSLTGIAVNGNTIMAVATNKVFTSTDYGESWTDQPGAPVGNWSCVAANTAVPGEFVMVESNSTVGTHKAAKTLDGGVTWTTALTGIDQAWSFMVRGVGKYIVSRPSSTSTPSVMTSIDGLTGWVVTKSDTVAYTDMKVGNDGIKIVRIGISTTTVWRIDVSLDDGATWTETSFGPTSGIGTIRPAVISPSGPGFVIVGAGSTTGYTDPNFMDVGTNPSGDTLTWFGRTIGKNTLGTHVHFSAIDAGPFVVVIGDGLFSFISMDGGDSWTKIMKSHDGPFVRMAKIALPNGKTRLIAIAGLGATTPPVGGANRIATLDI